MQQSKQKRSEPTVDELLDEPTVDELLDEPTVDELLDKLEKESASEPTVDELLNGMDASLRSAAERLPFEVEVDLPPDNRLPWGLRGGQFQGMLPPSPAKPFWGTEQPVSQEIWKPILGLTQKQKADALKVYDIEERPRKALLNVWSVLNETSASKPMRVISAAMRMKPLEAIREKLPEPSFSDIKKAISDGLIESKQYQMFTDITRRAGLTQSELANFNAYMEKHPKLKRIDDVGKYIDELTIAVLAESLMAKAGLTAIGAAADLLKGRIGTKTFTEAIGEEALKRGYYKQFFDNPILETGAGIIGDIPDISGDLGHALKVAYINKRIAEGTLDRNTLLSMVKLATGSRISGDLTKTVKLPKDVTEYMRPALTKELKMPTFHLARKQTTPKFTTVSKLEQMQGFELDAVVDMINEASLARGDFKGSILARVNREAYGPPPQVFRSLGLEDTYLRLQETLGDSRAASTARRVWYNRKTKEFRKRFGVKWDKDWSNALGYVAEPEVEMPDELIGYLENKFTKPTDMEDIFDFLNDWIDEDMELHWKFTGDIAESRGMISSDPEKIAAGIPERKERYHHWIHEKVAEDIKERYAEAERLGLKKEALYPYEYRIQEAMKKKPPKDVNIGEFMARRGKTDDISFDYDVTSSIAWDHQLAKLLNEPEFARAALVAEAIPDMNQSGAALRFLTRWMKNARNFPSGTTQALNRIFGGSQDAQRFTKFANALTRYERARVMAANFRNVGKNFFQPLNTINIVGTKSSTWGLKSLVTPDGRRLLAQSKVLAQRDIPLVAMTGQDITMRKWFERLMYKPMSFVDRYLNVSHAFNSSMHYQVTRNPKYWNALVKYGKTIGVTERQLKHGKFTEVLAMALESGDEILEQARIKADHLGITYSQWRYELFNAPAYLNSPLGRVAGQFTHWPSYMYGAHLPQLWDQLVTGKDIFGMKAPLEVRYAIVAHIAKVGAVASFAREAGIDMSFLALSGPMPTGRVAGKEVPFPVTPAVEDIIGIVGVGAGAGKEIFDAIGGAAAGSLAEDAKLLDNSLRILGAYGSGGAERATNLILGRIPGNIGARRVKDIIAKESPLWSILYPPVKKEKKKGGASPFAPPSRKERYRRETRPRY